MATTKRITRKEIRQPDEFMTLSARGIEFAQAHARELIIGVASVIVLGLLIWAASAYSAKKEADASRMLGQVQSLLHPISTSPEGGQAPVPTEPTPEETGQAQALLEDLVQNYKRTEASNVARILLGQRHYESRNYDAAIEAYEAFLKKGNRKPELTAMAWEGLAYSHEAKEDFAEAASCYEELSRTSMTNLHGWAYLGMARCYEKLGELEKASDAYRTLITDYPQHPKAAEANASIARMAPSLDSEDH